MDLSDNKKELEHGFLKINECFDYANRAKDVTLLYYPDINKIGLRDFQSKINFEVLSYYDNQDIKKVRLWEFQSKIVNQGYGTVILQEFFNYFTERQTQPVTIVGKLSDVDEEDENNRQRRDYLYEKFKFEFLNGWVEIIIN
ncbi:hypothetical protein RyT2_25290 [Pseudolactococcus yaeyamensis]